MDKSCVYFMYKVHVFADISQKQRVYVYSIHFHLVPRPFLCPFLGPQSGGMIDFFSEGFSRLAPRFQPVSYVTSNYDIPGEVSFVPRHELQRMPFYEDL